MTITVTSIQRVSTDSNGNQGNGSSINYTLTPAFTTDSTKAIFNSWASNLVPDDTNPGVDHFYKDLTDGSITRVVPSGPVPYLSPAYSPDGTKMAFLSYATDLVPNDTNNKADIFIQNLIDGTIIRVSTDSAGNQSNGLSMSPIFSPDGTKLVFLSEANNLVSGDTNNLRDVFIKDLITGELICVSSDADGNIGNDISVNAVFSPDGTKIAFISKAGNLVPDDTNNKADLFIKNLTDGSIERVATMTTTVINTTASPIPSFSADGTKIVFHSTDNSLVLGDTNNASDVFVKDLVDGTILRLSLDINGNAGNKASYLPQFSPDGLKVLFTSEATNLVADDTNNARDVFVVTLDYSSHDPILGDEDANYIVGTDEADTIYGYGGKDRIFSGTGSDSVDAGAGADAVSGSYGADTIHGGDGGDNLNGQYDNDSILGGRGNDSIDGGTGDDYLDGASGTDLIEGKEGNDIIYGGSGNDTITGGSGNDTINAGGGDDIITAGSGQDIMFGGSGADRFVFAVNDSSYSAHDRIRDFTEGEDKIDLSSMNAHTFSDLRIVSGLATTTIQTLVWGENFKIRLEGVYTTLDESDFIFA
jgi:Ca2+-binding RTX toxin-like protein